jgi:hypothetical protein
MRISAIVTLCASLLLLAGCDKVRQVDSLQAELESTKQQVTELRVELARAKGRLDALEAAAQRASLVEAERQQRAAAEGARGPTPAQIENLKKTISLCVDAARKSAPGDAMAQEFDAFYNPGNGQVQNNVRFQGQRPALYAFNKCMTERGIPLA